jgi:hypothetical protein
MNMFDTRAMLASVAIFALTACGAGGAGGSGGGDTTEPTGPPVEVVRADYPVISDRTATANAGMAYILLDGQVVATSDSVTISYGDGVISGGVLNTLDIDDSAFSNPANGEYARVFRITGENLFGVVGLDVPGTDLPASGTVTSYNEGWVGMQAIFEDRVLTLEGDATFTANWSGGLSGRFFNLSGQNSQDQSVTNVGTIVLTGATITGDTFANGTVTGTGAFAGLGGTSNTSGTSGFFFGPDVDELGGVLVINDATRDIFVIGGFQAD